MWNLDTVLSSKPVLPLARNDCKDGVISLDNIHNDVSMYKSKGNPRGVSLQTVCRKFLT